MAKDMSKAQFDAACKRYGFRQCGFMGYYSLPGHPALVSVLNAGHRRREQLAYLIQQLRKQDEKEAASVTG